LPDLQDLGVRSIRLLSRSQHTYVGLGGFGIEITGTEGLWCAPMGISRRADRRRR